MSADLKLSVVIEENTNHLPTGQRESQPIGCKKCNNQPTGKKENYYLEYESIIYNVCWHLLFTFMIGKENLHGFGISLVKNCKN